MNWIEQHQLISGIGAYYLFSNCVQALPPPTDPLPTTGLGGSSPFYRWFFVFSHGLAGNLKYALHSAAPQYVPADPPKSA